MGRLSGLLVVSAAVALAQPFSFGVMGGLPITGLLSGAATQRYTLGPTVQFALPRRFALGADLLYKRSDIFHRWELPLLLKYRFTGGPMSPFVGVGASFNRVTEHLKLAELRHRKTRGVAAGIGMEKRFGVLRTAAEIRLTRWADRNFGVRDSPLRSNLTQVELLISGRF